MGGKQSKSVDPVQTEVVPPYTKVKQLVERFENGSLRAKNAVVTDPSSQEHVNRLDKGLQAINQLIDKIDRESADKTTLLLELMQVFSQLRYHSLMCSDALNKDITDGTEKAAPICSEKEFNEIRKALDVTLRSLSELPADLIGRGIAGKAVAEAKRGKGYDETHGFLEETDRCKLSETSSKFFKDINAAGHKFLTCVAYGKQDEAKILLQKINPSYLLHEGTFTDYSGRKFTCTAYEYAYWAKDTHMQRMLEKYMDADIAQEMLRRVNEIERIDKI